MDSMEHFTMGTGGHYITMLPADWPISTSHDPLPSSCHSEKMLWNPSIRMLWTRLWTLVSNRDGDHSICRLPLIKDPPIFQCSHYKLWNHGKHCVKATDEDWQLNNSKANTTSQNWVNCLGSSYWILLVTFKYWLHTLYSPLVAKHVNVNGSGSAE